MGKVKKLLCRFLLYYIILDVLIYTKKYNLECLYPAGCLTKEKIEIL